MLALDLEARAGGLFPPSLLSRRYFRQQAAKIERRLQTGG